MAELNTQPFDAIPDALLVVSREGSIVFANDLAAALFGYEPGELTGTALESLLPVGRRDGHAKLMREYFSEPAARPMGMGRELQGLRGDGEEFPVEVAIGPIDGGGYALAVVRDITAAIRVRNELRESEERFRIAAAHAADVLQHVNVENNRYVWFGDVDGLMGYEPGEFPRTFDGWLEQIHPDDTERITAEVERIVENGEPEWNLRYRIRAKDGSYRHWFDRGTVTGFVEGRANEGIGAIIDRTEEVLARRELEQALREIGRLNDRLEAEGQYLREEIKSRDNFEEIVGSSTALVATLEKTEQVAPTDASVLIQGETGTGKELLARAIHAQSPRSSRPLVKVDCTTLPPGLVESELFGHEKGAFTGAHESRPGRFELAHGGTILLDEIGDLPTELQSKLLRVIQEGELRRLGSKTARKIDVRVIAATNRDLRAEMRAGRFRADLYYRLSVFPLEIPPLRHRRDDVPQLAEFFLSQRSRALGKNVDRIPSETMDALVAYDWPGNIRELQNIIERAIILSPGRDLILAESLHVPGAEPPPSNGLLKQDLERVERQQIVDALDASNWKVKGEGNAASRLGLKPSTLRSRMKRLGIQRLSP